MFLHVYIHMQRAEVNLKSCSSRVYQQSNLGELSQEDVESFFSPEQGGCLFFLATL